MKEFLSSAFAVLLVALAGVALFLAFYGAAAIVSPALEMDLRPNAASDFANWVQAVGSIVAIWGAYFIGQYQAKAAHKSAVTVEELRREQRELGADTLQKRLLSTCEEAVNRMSRSRSADDFTFEWQDSLGPAFRAATRAFDAMPLFEVCRPDRIQLALRIREISAEIADMGERACLPSEPHTYAQDRWLHMTRAHRKFISRVQRLRKEFDGGAA